jgi:hypothetical protein
MEFCVDLAVGSLSAPLPAHIPAYYKGTPLAFFLVANKQQQLLNYMTNKGLELRVNNQDTRTWFEMHNPIDKLTIWMPVSKSTLTISNQDDHIVVGKID